jgi:hypothetical protein
MLYKKGRLHCSLSRISEKSLDKMKQKAQVLSPPRTHVTHPWEDVCLFIGAPGAARNTYGRKTKADVPHIDQFKEWLKVTLDTNPPSKIIRTIHGDLIRDPNYQVNMYMKGLLLLSGGTSGRSYACGYNFVNGSTTSDCDVLSGDGDESEDIMAVWAEAIGLDDPTDSDITTGYTDLLLSSINKKGDVIF